MSSQAAKCLDCRFAEWDRTSRGALHPNGHGKCTWDKVIKMNYGPPGVTLRGHLSSLSPFWRGDSEGFRFEFSGPLTISRRGDHAILRCPAFQRGEPKP